MAEYNELVQAIRYLVLERLQQQAHFVHGLLGDGQGRVAVPGRPDYSYVRPNRSTNVSFEVFNKEVAGPDGWPVLIGELPWQPGLTQIVGTDWAAYNETGWGSNAALVGPHARQHEWPDIAPGTDPLNVYRRSLAEMKTYPLGSGSQSVYVSPYDYDYGVPKSWPGLPGLDLAAAAPATGTARLMLTYLDPVSNAIGAVTGSVGVYSDAVDLPRPTLPTGTWFPSAYVRLYGGQSTILERDIWDARRLFSGGISTGTASGGAPSGPAGGDLTGTYPDPTVDGLQGRSLLSTVPNEGDVLTWTGSAWRPWPATARPPTGPAGGDLTGTYPDPTVDGLQGRSLLSTAPNEGEVLTWTGSAWRPWPATARPPTGPAGGDLTGTYPDPRVAGLFGYSLASTPPAEGNVLMFSGSAWRPSTYQAGGGWKLSNEVLVVGVSGDYATFALAVAAAISGDTILLDIGTWACDGLTLPDGVSLIGVNRDACILSTSTQNNCLMGGNGSYLKDFTIYNTHSDAGSPTRGLYIPAGKMVKADNIISLVENAPGTGYGFDIIGDASVLKDCETLVYPATDGAGFYCESEGNLYLIDCHGEGPYGAVQATGLTRVYGGSFNGSPYGIDDIGGNMLMYNLPRVGGNYPYSEGIIQGLWIDASSQGQIHSQVDFALYADEMAAKPTQPVASNWALYFKAAGLFVEDDAGAETGPLGVGGGGGDPAVCDGRLTLTSATPITTADVLAAATLYFTPYKGNSIGLYNGATWDILTFAELSLNLAGYNIHRAYDVWAYNNAGVVALESTAWVAPTSAAITTITNASPPVVNTGTTPTIGQTVTIFGNSVPANNATWRVGTVVVGVSFQILTLAGTNPPAPGAVGNGGTWTHADGNTARATALVLQDGIYCKTGALTRRYLGTIQITNVAGQTEDNSGVTALPGQRLVWNMYNRALRSIATTKAGTWTYGSATVRGWGNDHAQRVNLVRGLDEDLIVIDCVCGANGFNASAAMGVGLDVVNALAAGCKSPSTQGPTAAQTHPVIGLYKGYTGTVGFHFYQHIEWTGGANVTFLGQSVGGMSGYCLA